MKLNKIQDAENGHIFYFGDIVCNKCGCTLKKTNDEYFGFEVYINDYGSNDEFSVDLCKSCFKQMVNELKHLPTKKWINKCK